MFGKDTALNKNSCFDQVLEKTWKHFVICSSKTNTGSYRN